MRKISGRVRITAVAAAVMVVFGSCYAATMTVDMYKATQDGRGESIGQVTIEETAYGLVFTPKLSNLPAGPHGFHIHEKADCSPSRDDAGKITPAGAAGSHYDPKGTGSHSTPWDDNGHLGDLPVLLVDKDGKASMPVLAPKLKKLDDVRNRSLMIHEGGDNYSNQPENGGGGSRIACGIIK